jgi:hypothetical protein
MKTQTEGPSSPAPGPQISLLEKDEHTKAGKFPGHQEKVNKFRIPADPNKLKKFEYDELLAKARDRILNDDFVAKLVSAMIEKSLSNKSVRKLVEIENNLVEACIDLGDTDIDNLVGQLNMKSLQYLSKNEHIQKIPRQAHEDIYSGRWNPYSAGIKSVVHFIRERSKLLMLEPSKKFAIGFNDRLDVDRKIDLIEIIFTEVASDIEQLNLIQVKNSTPNEKEISDIVNEHRSFANFDILRLGDIKDFDLSEEMEEQLFEETLSNQAIMIEKIFEICVNYQKVNPEVLIDMLGLGNLSNFQKSWLLDTNLEIIIKQVGMACDEGYIGEQDKNNLIQDLQSLDKTLTKKAGIPLKMVQINSVNSLIAVGSNVIKEVNVYNPKNPRETLLATT